MHRNRGILDFFVVQERSPQRALNPFVDRDVNCVSVDVHCGGRELDGALRDSVRAEARCLALRELKETSVPVQERILCLESDSEHCLVAATTADQQMFVCAAEGHTPVLRGCVGLPCRCGKVSWKPEKHEVLCGPAVREAAHFMVDVERMNEEVSHLVLASPEDHPAVTRRFHMQKEWGGCTAQSFINPNYFAVCYSDYNVRFWDTRNGSSRPMKTMWAGKDCTLSSIMPVPNRPWNVAAMTKKGQVFMFDVRKTETIGAEQSFNVHDVLAKGGLLDELPFKMQHVQPGLLASFTFAPFSSRYAVCAVTDYMQDLTVALIDTLEKRPVTQYHKRFESSEIKMDTPFRMHVADWNYGLDWHSNCDVIVPTAEGLEWVRLNGADKGTRRIHTLATEASMNCGKFALCDNRLELKSAFIAPHLKRGFSFIS